ERTACPPAAPGREAHRRRQRGTRRPAASVSECSWPERDEVFGCTRDLAYRITIAPPARSSRRARAGVSHCRPGGDGMDRPRLLCRGALGAVLCLVAALTTLALPMPAALGQQISKDELIFLTPEWTGERFDDGRPRVPDDILERMKLVTLEEAWAVLRGQDFNFQFEGDWQVIDP